MRIRKLQGAPVRYRVTHVQSLASMNFARCIIEVVEPGEYDTVKHFIPFIAVRILKGGPRDWQGKQVKLYAVRLRKLRERSGETCTCIAYAWPHRRGAGLCNES